MMYWRILDADLDSADMQIVGSLWKFLVKRGVWGLDPGEDSIQFILGSEQ